MPVKEKMKTNGNSTKVKGTTTKKVKSNGSSKEFPMENYRETIEKLAYEIWEKRGKQPSDGIAEWIEAEQMIKEKFSKN
jgi:hypothetical protein